MAQDSLVVPALGKQQENQKFKVNYNYSNFKARSTNLEMPDWGFLLCGTRPLGRDSEGSLYKSGGLKGEFGCSQVK